MDNLILSPIPLSELLDQVRKAVREEMAANSPPGTPAAPGKPVTTQQLCEFLGVTEPTILRWRKQKKIPFFTIGTAVRFDLDKVIKALENEK